MFNLYTFLPVEGEADYLIEAKLAYQVSRIVGHKSEWTGWMHRQKV